MQFIFFRIIEWLLETGRPREFQQLEPLELDRILSHFYASIKPKQKVKPKKISKKQKHAPKDPKVCLSATHGNKLNFVFEKIYLYM